MEAKNAEPRRAAYQPRPRPGRGSVCPPQPAMARDRPSGRRDPRPRGGPRHHGGRARLVAPGPSDARDDGVAGPCRRHARGQRLRRRPAQGGRRLQGHGPARVSRGRRRRSGTGRPGDRAHRGRRRQGAARAGAGQRAAQPCRAARRRAFAGPGAAAGRQRVLVAGELRRGGGALRSGEVVAPLAASAFSKSAVVTVADLRSLQVEADVAESNLEAIGPDQPCEIVLDAYPDVRYPGVVAKIVPTADRAKATVQVKVAFRGYDARVLPELSAKVHFLPRPGRVAVDTQPVLVVPATAVAERNGRSVVFVVEAGRAVEVPVAVGRQLGSSVAVREGLRPGALVVDSVGARRCGGAKVTVQ